MPALSTWTPEDGVLGAVAPLAMAAAAGTALVVDLDPHGPAYPGAVGLAGLVSEGPTRLDLEPALAGDAADGTHKMDTKGSAIPCQNSSASA